MKFCTDCGNKLEDDAKFCTECGNKMPGALPETARAGRDEIIPVVTFELSGKIERAKPKSRKGPVIAVVFVIIVLLAAAAVVAGNLYFDLDFFPFNLFPAKTMTAAELLDLGEKYLLDLNYEQAIVHFEKLIEIEPMNPRGYTGAAEAYAALGRVDEAVAVLKRGLEILPDNKRIKTILDTLQ